MLKFTTISMLLFWVGCSWGDPSKVGHTDPVEQAVTTVRRSQEIAPLFGNGIGDASSGASTSMGDLLGLGLGDASDFAIESDPNLLATEQSPKKPLVTDVIIDNEVVSVFPPGKQEEDPVGETLDADGNGVNLVGERVLPEEEIVQAPSVEAGDNFPSSEILPPKQKSEEKTPKVAANPERESSRQSKDSDSPGEERPKPAIARSVRLPPRVANAFNQIRRQVARMNGDQKNQMRAFLALQDKQEEIEKRLAGYHPQGGKGVEGGLPPVDQKRVGDPVSNGSGAKTALEQFGGVDGAGAGGLDFVDPNQLAKVLNNGVAQSSVVDTNSGIQKDISESPKSSLSNGGNLVGGVSAGVGKALSFSGGTSNSLPFNGSSGSSSEGANQGALSPAEGTSTASANEGKSVVGDGLAAWSAIPFERLLRLQQAFLARQKEENVALGQNNFEGLSGDSKAVIAAGVGVHWRWVGEVADPIKSAQWIETIEKTTGLSRDAAWALYYTALSAASLASLLFLFWVGRRWRQNLEIFFPISKRDSQRTRK